MSQTAIADLEIPRKTSAAGLALPAYGLGTWGMGGTFAADTSRDEPCVEAIRRCLDRGVTHIDTAEMYGEGHAEELVGRAIRGRPRSELVITSKALAHHLGREALIRAAEGSLARLGCGYLDLYLAHHPSDDIPLEETMGAMDELIRRGLVRHAGVANFSRERLARARAASPRPIACNQVHYSLAVREPESTGLLEYCRSQGILLVAWQPIDRGLYGREPTPLVRRLCRTHGCTPVQLALAWLINQPGVAALVCTTGEDHLRENLGALAIRLRPEDIAALRVRYERQLARSPVYPLR